MTKKVEKAEEDVQLTYDQKLLQNIKELERVVDKLSVDLQQHVGALHYAKMVYNDYMESIKKE